MDNKNIMDLVDKLATGDEVRFKRARDGLKISIKRGEVKQSCFISNKVLDIRKTRDVVANFIMNTVDSLLFGTRE